MILENELVVLMPVYNDWDTLSLLLLRLDQEVKTNNLRARLVLVDDGSTITLPEGLVQSPFQSIINIDVVSLRRKLGHQRAIAIGLSYVEANHPQSLVVVMDSDGEDDPKDVPRLVREAWPTGRSELFSLPE
jgi:glycosyltransferase involved in cell wall biosynthesis